VLGYLAERGADQETLARVRVPAGLDLGPTGHREIAVAILAELVQLGAAGQLAGPQTPARSAAARSAAARPRAGTVTQAADPVCGMTVEVGAGTRSAQCDGQTYYFCSAGCQQAFEKRLLTRE
jgi:xanthine dehydrogenase accessory factor